MFLLQVSRTTLLLRIHLYDFRPLSNTHTRTRPLSHARHGTAHSRVSRVCDVSGGVECSGLVYRDADFK